MAGTWFIWRKSVGMCQDLVSRGADRSVPDKQLPVGSSLEDFTCLCCITYTVPLYTDGIFIAFCVLKAFDCTYFGEAHIFGFGEPMACTWQVLGILAQSVEHSTGNREVRGSVPRNVTFIGLPYDWNHQLLTVASVCSPFYAEVLLAYISTGVCCIIASV